MDSFLNILESNHMYIDQVYIFIAVIYLVLVLLFEGFGKLIITGIITLITTVIGLYIIKWLNTSNYGKYHLFGWILVVLSSISTFSYLLSKL